ncbi:unnamed protein product [Cochlearia groenlandica]
MTNYRRPKYKQQDETKFLEMRQRIKDTIRHNTQSENIVAPNTYQIQKHFCSFFGPSQTIIASKKKIYCPSSGYLIAKNPERSARELNESRDYSFLFSDDDDAKLPSSSTTTSTVKPKIQEPLTCGTSKNIVEQIKESQQLKKSSKYPPLKKPNIQLKTNKRKSTKEDELALRMVRKMCKIDRFAGRSFYDFDDKSMETNFEDIIKEEKRSEKLAKKEDTEQLMLIKEENRREIAKKAKKQKLDH